LSANGATEPCQVLQGPLTTLMTAGATVIDRKDSFHVAQFLTSSTVDIFARKAEGNEAPSRSFMLTMTNDLLSIAVDSHLNDFVMTVRPSGIAALNFIEPCLPSPAIRRPARKLNSRDQARRYRLMARRDNVGIRRITSRPSPEASSTADDSSCGYLDHRIVRWPRSADEQYNHERG